jgi:hypothetical protein
MTKAILFFIGMVYWMTIHRYGRLYMGEATLIASLTIWAWYGIRKHREANWEPNFYGERREIWTPWHILSFMAGGICLGGVTRFLI